MPSPIVSLVAKPLFDLIDKLFTSDAEREEARRKLAELERRGELEQLQTTLSAVLAEAQSPDPWTSRARPTFLYVVYLFILAALPAGIVSIFYPEATAQASAGVKAWLEAIPEDVWWLFGAGYLGYSATRSFDKWKGGRR